MAKFKDAEEFKRVMMIRKLTGKKAQTCLFCLRLARGNFRRAVELCSAKSKSKEDGRQKLPVDLEYLVLDRESVHDLA